MVWTRPLFVEPGLYSSALNGRLGCTRGRVRTLLRLSAAAWDAPASQIDIGVPVEGVQPGETAYVQVVAWNTKYGLFEDAQAAGGAWFTSPLLEVTTGESGSPAPLTGLVFGVLLDGQCGFDEEISIRRGLDDTFFVVVGTSAETDFQLLRSWNLKAWDIVETSINPLSGEVDPVQIRAGTGTAFYGIQKEQQ